MHQVEKTSHLLAEKSQVHMHAHTHLEGDGKMRVEVKSQEAGRDGL